MKVVAQYCWFTLLFVYPPLNRNWKLGPMVIFVVVAVVFVAVVFSRVFKMMSYIPGSPPMMN